MGQAQLDELARTLRELALSFVRDAPPNTISRVAASTLSALERLGPQRITVLAEREVVSQPAMTGLVQRLEAAGYVSRSADPDDGRATLVTITPAGTHAVGVRRTAHDRAIGQRLARLSPDDLALLTTALPALSHLIHDLENHALV